MKNLVKGFVLLALFATMLMPASFAGAASNTVDTLIDEVIDGDGCTTDCTLREAISLAGNGDTVDFSAGLGGGTLILTQGEITFSAGMTIDGSAVPALWISGNSANRIFRIIGTAPGQPPTITNLQLRDGSVSGTGGGAIFINDGFVNIINCTFAYNGSSGAGSDGGAVSVHTSLGDSSVSIEKSIFAYNTNTGGTAGGAVAIIDDGTTGPYLGVLNSTFFQNSGPVAGAVYNSGAQLEVVNSTISETSSTGGGGAAVTTVGGGSFLAQNNIIANNTVGVGCNVTPSPQTNNIEDGTSCGWGSSSGSLSSTDPLLGLLGGYGGPTSTLPLLPGSPAINLGDAATCATYLDAADQRGIAYVGNCDVGAYESRGVALAVVSGDNQTASVGMAFASPLVVSVTPAGLEPVDGGIVSFRGPLSGAGTTFGGFTTQTISGGSATLGVTANTMKGAYSVTADTSGRTGLPVSFNLTNTSAVSSTTIDSDTPDPSYPGETVTVTVTVTGLSPGGTVDITGADTNCTVALAGGTGSCDVGFTASGSRTLTATYGGDTSNAGSADTEAHEVFFPPGDSDLDGNADIFWRDVQQGATFISYFTGTTYSGTFKALKRMVAAPWIMAGGGDFDRDGQTDIFWRNPVSGANVIAHYQGTTLVNFKVFQNQSPEWRAFGTGDVNKDRYPDIFWYNTDTMENEVWYMQDNTVLGTVDLPRAPAPWVPVAVADFDGDTNPDAVALNSVTGRAVIALLSATNLQAVAKLPVASTGWDACGTIDMSGDNLPDIIWRDPVTGANEAWVIQNNARTSTVALPTVKAPFQCMAGHK